jgi:hypothetical protein
VEEGAWLSLEQLFCKPHTKNSQPGRVAAGLLHKRVEKEALAPSSFRDMSGTDCQLPLTWTIGAFTLGKERLTVNVLVSIGVPTLFDRGCSFSTGWVPSFRHSVCWRHLSESNIGMSKTRRATRRRKVVAFPLGWEPDGSQRKTMSSSKTSNLEDQAG